MDYVLNLQDVDIDELTKYLVDDCEKMSEYDWSGLKQEEETVIQVAIVAGF